MADQPSQQQPTGKQWVDLLAVGNKGINNFKSQLKIDPSELSDGQNVEFADGDLSVRGGSVRMYRDDNFAQETFVTQLITAHDSRGTEYLLQYVNGIVGLWDQDNSHWIQLNPNINFTNNDKFGFVNWNNGFGAAWNEGADVLYMGNGADQQVKWVMARGITQLQVLDGNNYIVLDSSASFPPIYDAWHDPLISQPIIVSDSGSTNATTANYIGLVAEDISIQTQPADGDFITLNINSTAILIHFVAAIGVAAGNVLIGANAIDTRNNLLGLLQHPSTTSTTQVALSSPNQALVGYLSWGASDDGNDIYGYQINTLLAGITGTISGAGGSVTDFPGILVLDMAWTAGTFSNSSVVNMPLQNVFDRSGDEIVAVKGGRLMVTVGSRIYTSGIDKQETDLVFTGININAGGQPHPDPELYTGSSNGIASGGLQEFADGDGPILALADTLENLLVFKKNSIRKFGFQTSSALDAQLPVISPVYTGESSGSISAAHTITVNMNTYYPTSQQGISILTPTYSYGNIYFQPSIISWPIQDLATTVGYDVGEVAYSNNKVLFAVSKSDSSVPNFVLFYDLLAAGWGIIDGWYVNSWTKYRGDLLFADRGQFDTIKKAFTDNFDDAGQAYTTFALSPQYSFSELAKLKENDMLYIQGTINRGGKVYVDIYYNANNGVWKATYLIDAANPNITFVQDKLFGSDTFGSLPFVGGSGSSSTGFFNFYLVNNVHFEWNTIQFKIYSTDIGSNWTVQGLGMSPVTVEALNSDSFLYPT